MTNDIRTPARPRGRLGKALLAAALIAAPAAIAASALAQPASSQPPSTAPADASSGQEYTVTMASMDYGASPSGLKVGDTIVWVNHDTVMHSVTARDHSFDLRLNPGQSAKLTLSQPGRIPFYCLFHPSMRGTLVVAAK